MESVASTIFDEVMRDPASRRGLNVDETCRLLAEAAKMQATSEGYGKLLNALELIYTENFLHTAAFVPGFAERLSRGMARYR